jgi:hypothetical protein
MYSSGGWTIMPKSCNSGFKVAAVAGVGSSRSNGFDVNSMKAAGSRR